MHVFVWGVGVGVEGHCVGDTRPTIAKECKQCYPSVINVLFRLAYLRGSFSVALRPQRPYGLLGTGSPGRPPRLSHSS